MGFKLDTEDSTGWQFKYLTRGGGYYFNVGCSELIVEKKIRLAQFSDIETFVADGARLRTGELIPAELVVTATGYSPWIARGAAASAPRATAEAQAISETARRLCTGGQTNRVR